MKNDLDNLLRKAFIPNTLPKAELNQKVLLKIKENECMKNKKHMYCRRVPAAVLLAVFILALGSVTAMAAYHYLNPSDVVVELDDSKLETAFLGKDAILVQETKECGDYFVTLLGSVAGRNISDYLMESTSGIREDRIYTVVAFERVDGMPMPDTSSDEYGKEQFFVSHYVKGLNPSKYSIMSMGGGYQEFVKDGIMYRLIEMDNIEIFADRGIYVGVNSGTFFDSNAFIYEENSGVMKVNEEFSGVSALFVLPVDENKADPEAAQKYLKDMEVAMDAPDEPRTLTDADMDVEAFIAIVNSENLDNYAKPVEGTKQICEVDESGIFSYSWETEGGAGGNGTDEVSNVFKERTAGERRLGSYSYSEHGLQSLYIQVFTLNEDGTVTFEVYQPKIEE